MSTQPIDYAAMLADLEAKKASIEAAIASVRAAMATGVLGIALGDALTMKDSVAVSLQPALPPPPFNGDIPSGMFTGKSIPEATKLYLSMVNRKQTTKEIAQALEDGGLHTTSNNFAGTVEAGLFRASRKFGEIVRVKGQWALAEWFKGMRIGPREPAKPKSKSKLKPKSKHKTRSAGSKAAATKTAPKPALIEAPKAESDSSDNIRVLPKAV